jgi:hypothetical protein
MQPPRPRRRPHRGVRWALFVVSHPAVTIPVSLAALAGLVWRIVQAPEPPAWLVFATGLLGCVLVAVAVTGLMSERRR